MGRNRKLMTVIERGMDRKTPSPVATNNFFDSIDYLRWRGVSKKDIQQLATGGIRAARSTPYVTPDYLLNSAQIIVRDGLIQARQYTRSGSNLPLRPPTHGPQFLRRKIVTMATRLNREVARRHVLVDVGRPNSFVESQVISANRLDVCSPPKYIWRANKRYGGSSKLLCTAFEEAKPKTALLGIAEVVRKESSVIGEYFVFHAAIMSMMLPRFGTIEFVYIGYKVYPDTDVHVFEVAQTFHETEEALLRRMSKDVINQIRS